MGKPRRSLQTEFFDIFADWPLDDQEAALRVLNEYHRQARRQDRKKKAQGTVPVADQPEMAGAEEDGDPQ